jgi:hypothetical protein
MISLGNCTVIQCLRLNLKREHTEVSWIIYKVQGKVSTHEEMEAEKWR